MCKNTYSESSAIDWGSDLINFLTVVAQSPVKQAAKYIVVVENDTVKS